MTRTIKFDEHEDGVVRVTASEVTSAPNDPIESGDPCAFNLITGVAESDEVAADDVVVIRRNGVHTLSVVGADGAGNAAVAYGDLVYVDASGVVNADDTNGVRLGYALGAVASGATTSIDVLVDP